MQEKKTLELKVEVDNRSGFCFGVVYAIAMAEEILSKEKRLYCLGDIVHNDEEIKRLENLGLKIIKHADLPLARNSKVLIRAHGEPPSTYKRALEYNISLIDASCPVVLKLQHRIKKSYEKDEKIVIYGKSGHAEIIGLQGQVNNEAVVIQSIEELKKIELPQHITLYSQTTKNAEDFHKLREELLRLGYSVNTNDTICNQVSNRKHLEDFARRFDKVVFVAGKNSSNGQVLYNLCKISNPNTIFISSSRELDGKLFSRQDSIGICGATSTPMWLMNEIKDKLVAL